MYVHKCLSGTSQANAYPEDSVTLLTQEIWADAAVAIFSASTAKEVRMVEVGSLRSSGRLENTSKGLASTV